MMSQTETTTASAYEVLAAAKTLEAKALAEMKRLEARSESVVKNSNAALALGLQYEFAKQSWQAAGYLIDVTEYNIVLEQAYSGISLANLTPAEEGLKATIRRQRDKIKMLEAALKNQKYEFNQTLEDLNAIR